MVIAAFSVAAIALHLVFRFGFHTAPGTYQTPLLAALVLGGLPLLYDLLRKLLKREFGSDLLGGISIITSVWLGDGLMVTTDFSAARTSDERETAGR